MRTQTTPSVSPNGLGGNIAAVAHDARASRPVQPPHRRAEPSNNRNADFDNHDDGLVHGHFWAMSSTIR